MSLICKLVTVILVCRNFSCNFDVVGFFVFLQISPFCGSVAELLACWTQLQKARVQIAAATLSGNSLGQTVHTHRASVHQGAKLVAALLRVGLQG